MHTLSKNYSKAVLIALLSLISAIFVFICLPQITSAATGTLGSEEPYVYFTYENAENGETADGNQLDAGTYNVSIHLSGMANSSIVQVTGTYDTESASVASTPVAVLSDTVTDMESMGYILEDGNIVFGFVSTNDACSVLGDDVVIAEIQVTFAQACDADTVISVSVSPDLTFAQADYGDGLDDEYSLTADADKDVNYTGTLYPMTCDVTPAFGYDVTGSLVVMTDNTGSTNNVPVYGEYTINVYSDAERTDLIKSVKSVQNENANSFVIEGLTNGTYFATITGTYAMTRDDITIVVNGNDIAGPAIPVIACNFDGNTAISPLDAVPIYAAQSLTNENAYLNLDGNNAISPLDAAIVYACGAGEFSYSPITIEEK